MSFVDHQTNKIVEATDCDAVAVAVDRRRPGRAPVSPELLPLLRGVQLSELEDEDENTSPPLVGIACAVALSVPLWLAIGTVVWLVR